MFFSFAAFSKVLMGLTSPWPVLAFLVMFFQIVILFVGLTKESL